MYLDIVALSRMGRSGMTDLFGVSLPSSPVNFKPNWLLFRTNFPFGDKFHSSCEVFLPGLFQLATKAARYHIAISGAAP